MITQWSHPECSVLELPRLSLFICHNFCSGGLQGRLTGEMEHIYTLAGGSLVYAHVLLFLTATLWSG